MTSKFTMRMVSSREPRPIQIEVFAETGHQAKQMAESMYSGYTAIQLLCEHVDSPIEKDTTISDNYNGWSVWSLFGGDSKPEPAIYYDSKNPEYPQSYYDKRSAEIKAEVEAELARREAEEEEIRIQTGIDNLNSAIDIMRRYGYNIKYLTR